MMGYGSPARSHLLPATVTSLHPLCNPCSCARDGATMMMISKVGIHQFRALPNLNTPAPMQLYEPWRDNCQVLSAAWIDQIAEESVFEEEKGLAKCISNWFRSCAPASSYL